MQIFVRVAPMLFALALCSCATQSAVLVAVAAACSESNWRTYESATLLDELSVAWPQQRASLAALAAAVNTPITTQDALGAILERESPAGSVHRLDRPFLRGRAGRS